MEMIIVWLTTTHGDRRVGIVSARHCSAHEGLETLSWRALVGHRSSMLGVGIIG
jgi:hypothetical protein